MGCPTIGSLPADACPGMWQWRRALNVSAFPVLISSRFRIDPSFPSPSLFDHVITAIPRGDAFLFLDKKLAG
jgi:hypothetical protein